MSPDPGSDRPPPGDDALEPKPFERDALKSGRAFMTIGTGGLGGKASGLLAASRVAAARPFESGGRLLIEFPRTVVVTTGVFDAFMERSGLYDIALSGAADDRIALAFQSAHFPAEAVGDLAALVAETAGRPLAVRSSSQLEDSLAHPFAGIYQTKMVPNNQLEPAARFRALVEAIKFVYASAFSSGAIAYVRAVGKDPRDEKMAVVIQEVTGRRFGDRFYPEVSGICRSFSYYRTGSARPDEGVVTLALGLGKTIMDGGVSWSYSPAHPRARPPFSSLREMLKGTQLRFWAVNLGKPPEYDPIRETEYLVEADLDAAEADGALRNVASTYDAQNERMAPGIGNPGPRVIDFAPLVKFDGWPLTAACRHLLAGFRAGLGHAVEVEFALTFSNGPGRRARMAVLQVRPMAAPGSRVDVTRPAPDDDRVLVYSDRVMGNGAYTDLTDIVYVPPERFDGKLTRAIAREIQEVNERLRSEGRRYALIGFGRWGSSDPWLGIPVTWGQISGASVIVESTLPDMNVEPSQGAHFFLNIESFRVAYFTIPHSSRPSIDWDWLASRPVVSQTEHVRHVRAYEPLRVTVDGRTGRGLITKGPPADEVLP